jgi:hypothetical protein
VSLSPRTTDLEMQDIEYLIVSAIDREHEQRLEVKALLVQQFSASLQIFQ